jgi:hypothetical protein
MERTILRFPFSPCCLMEVDTVGHCGGDMGGNNNQTKA